MEAASIPSEPRPPLHPSPPIPSPEEVSQQIVDLTNDVFDRLGPRLAPYIADSRRERPDNGTTLTADNNNVLWEHGTYGRVAMYVANRKSGVKVFSSFLSDHSIRDIVRGPFSPSHYPLLYERGLELYEKGIKEPDTLKPRYQALGCVLLLHVLRDRYPRGDTGARESLMKPLEDYSKYPPEDWGERHKVGVELISGYQDAATTMRRVRWSFSFSVQSRFDKSEPQKTIESRFSGLVDTNDMGFGLGAFEPRKIQHKRASHLDVALMRGLFEQAKDLRPLVTPIRRQQREQAVISAMINDFFSRGESSGDTANGS